MRSAIPRTPLAIGLSALLAGCGPIVVPTSHTHQEERSAAAAVARRRDVETVAQWLTGSFSSADQSLRDPEFRHVLLNAARIWPDRQDGIWIYIEQALASARDKPYRQRVYRLFVQPNGLVVSEVYTLPGQSPLRYAGWWRKPGAFEDLSPKSLIKKGGCEVVLKKQDDGEWRGGTVGAECESDLEGASYASSEVAVSPERILTWDRGYDKDGKQVWGSQRGPYEFIRE